MLLNVLDYEDPAAAFEDAANGDRVYFPGVKPWEAPTSGWTITKSLEIFGDGPGLPAGIGGTRLMPGGPDSDVFVLDPAPGTSLPYLHFHDLRITRRPEGDARDGNDGIRFSAGMNRKLSVVRLERVAIDHLGGRGIALGGTDAGDNAVAGCQISECDISDCGDVGLFLKFVFQAHLTRCRFASNALPGCVAEESQVALYVCRFTGNSGGAGRQLTIRAPAGAASLARIDGCSFSGFGQGPACRIERAGGSAQIGGCVFDGGSYSSTAVGLEISGDPNASAVLVLPNRFIALGTAVSIADFAEICVVFPQFADPGNLGGTAILLPSQNDDAPIAIPCTNGPAGNLLSGLLVPAMATVSTTKLQDGMLYLDNSVAPKKLRARIGGTWKEVKLVPLTPITLSLPAAGRHSLITVWNAPTDPLGGPVTEYDLRRSTSPITEGNFADATELETQAPLDPGTQECITSSSLQSCTPYYYAIKYRDQSNAWSAISNVPVRSTLCSGTLEVQCA